MAVPHHLPASPPRPAPTATRGIQIERRGRPAPTTACALELARALRDGDPTRASFDEDVRRYVRAERATGQDLDTILASIAAIVREHVIPSLAPERLDALQHAIAWFAVSEYHRLD